MYVLAGLWDFRYSSGGGLGIREWGVFDGCFLFLRVEVEMGAGD